MTHYHVQVGLTGYGPDVSDHGGFHPYTLESAADGIREEINRQCDSLTDLAQTYADSGDYESAWKTHVLTGVLDTLARNVDPGRKDAPLYRGNPELWRAELVRIYAETFPLDVDIEGRDRLYVWTCDETECESDDDEL